MNVDDVLHSPEICSYKCLFTLRVRDKGNLRTQNAPASVEDRALTLHMRRTDRLPV